MTKQITPRSVKVRTLVPTKFIVKPYPSCKIETFNYQKRYDAGRFNIISLNVTKDGNRLNPPFIVNFNFEMWLLF